MTVKDDKGTVMGTFTTNQTGNSEVEITMIHDPELDGDFVTSEETVTQSPGRGTDFSVLPVLTYMSNIESAFLL